jgi:hypothetical protein
MALALKIELAIDEEVGTLTGGEICLAVLKRDVRRLMRRRWGRLFPRSLCWA